MIEPTDINPFPGWLEEVVNDPLVVDESKEGLNREARGNMWTFSISQSQSEVITTKDVIEFLDCVAQARGRQVKDLAGSEHTMVFYCWFDSQAFQLRFSLVSTVHKKLPFGAILEETDDFTRVVKLFLSSHYHDGIPLEEFVTEEVSVKRNSSELPPFVILVAAKMLPAKNNVS